MNISYKQFTGEQCSIRAQRKLLTDSQHCMSIYSHGHCTSQMHKVGPYDISHSATYLKGMPFMNIHYSHNLKVYMARIDTDIVSILAILLYWEPLRTIKITMDLGNYRKYMTGDFIPRLYTSCRSCPRALFRFSGRNFRRVSQHSCLQIITLYKLRACWWKDSYIWQV